ncbi:MAG: serine/threonine protein kinase, partial [Myxococcales bacterium]|nr:serine/threonine protein kinase [Myxococcales bacterium]
MSSSDETTAQSARDSGVRPSADTESSNPPSLPSLYPGELPCGSNVGRYVVLDRLGRGAMGVVYAAYDPELDRQIALKVLHDVRSDPAGLRRSRRLQREAQAMARLSHPNVIAVYDVGTFEERVFVAMEIVRGQTLTAWLRAADRTRAEIVEVHVAAGRGLQAAHEAGLVHRDFKPDNVLVGRDGRVRVTDFGIARQARSSLSRGESRGESPEGSLSDAHVGEREDGMLVTTGARVIDMTLTRPGALPGTPAYMSPEQFAGQSLDARGDQFSFCVALWGSLYGRPPFAGRTPSERAASVSAGQLQEPPSGSGVPSFLHRALVRGLAVNPADRYPDMGALLVALTHDPARRRRRWLAVGGLSALLVAGAGVALTRPGPCVAVDEPMAQTWSDERRAAVQAAILATALPYADDTWQRVSGRLDAYGDAWRAARLHACRATRVEHAQPEAQLERQVACLERRRAQLGALVDVLVEADPQVVREATAAVAGLPTLEDCAHADALLDQAPSSSDPEVQALWARFDHLVALEMAGRYDQAYALVPALVDEAKALGPSSALWVDALTLFGTLAVRVAPREAEALLRQAYFEAVRQHRDDSAARLATTLVFFVGFQQMRVDDALEWVEHASAAVDRAGADVVRRLVLVKNEGDVLIRAGELAQAQVRHERALALLDTVDDGSDARAQERIHVLSSLAVVKLERGQFDEAQRHLEQAQALIERVLGPRHPELARIHNELGNVAYHHERLDDARREYEAALELWRGDHQLAPAAVTSLTNLGNVHDIQGQTEQARARYEEALALSERLDGPDHPQVALVLVNLGLLLERVGEDAEARRVHARALQIRERALGAEHPALANPLLGVARVALAQGELEVARQHAERALALRRDPAEAEGFEVVQALVPLGMVAARTGDAAAAREHLERALAICGGHPCDDAVQGQACLELAALAERGSKARAHHLDQAREHLRRAGSAGERFLGQL